VRAALGGLRDGVTNPEIGGYLEYRTIINGWIGGGVGARVSADRHGALMGVLCEFKRV
jgi:hypothetical protein